MLARVLAAVRDAGRPMCLADLSAALDVEASALEGMLETLVARGRLRAFEVTEAGCRSCPVKGGCFVMRAGEARTYALPAGEVPRLPA